MVSVLLVLLLFGGVVALTVAWAFLRSIQWIGRALTGTPVRATSTGADPTVRCRNPGCRTANPQHARFCRRCGATFNLTGPGSVSPFANRSTEPMRVVARAV